MKSKIILYMSMTVNGYIATKNDDTPWSDEIWNGYYALIKKYGNIILGKRTFELMRDANEFEKLGFPITVVVSNSPENQGDEKTTFVSSPSMAVEIMQRKGVKEIIVGGGSMLNAGFLSDGLLDEIYLDIDPLIFGSGIRLFADTENVQAKLELVSVENLSKNILRVHYKILK